MGVVVIVSSPITAAHTHLEENISEKNSSPNPSSQGEVLDSFLPHMHYPETFTGVWTIGCGSIRYPIKDRRELEINYLRNNKTKKDSNVTILSLTPTQYHLTKLQGWITMGVVVFLSSPRQEDAKAQQSH